MNVAKKREVLSRINDSVIANKRTRPLVANPQMAGSSKWQVVRDTMHVLGERKIHVRTTRGGSITLVVEPRVPISFVLSEVIRKFGEEHDGDDDLVALAQENKLQDGTPVKQLGLSWEVVECLPREAWCVLYCTVLY